MADFDNTNDKLAHQYKLLRTIASVYLTVHEIDLVNNKVYDYNTSDDVLPFITDRNNAIESMRNVMSNVVTKEDRDRALTFSDLTTLADRMKNKKLITNEFIGVNCGWFKEQFIALDIDENGYPTSVIHTTEVIDEQKRKEEALLRISFFDELTNLYNRRFYDIEMKKAQLSMPNNFTYISMDLNGLKTINDNLGHAAGDEAIYGAARCIETAIADYGKVFRLGGDEFAAILNCNESTLSLILNNLDILLSNWKGASVDVIKLSVGYASSLDNPNTSVYDLAKIADEKMYQDKDEFYKKNKQLIRRIQ